ncbi:MAG: CsgG/HfaB family protein [Bacteroidota bacterium]|nr:CsgG/HfaB family protein [Bacteroidota bacterium]
MKKTLFSFLFVTSALFSQNKFYNYYTSGLEYIEKQDWQRAITELQSAASLEFEDVQRKRTYGTRFIEYFPHREIGIAHYMLGELDLAKKELELSIAYRYSDRADEYSKRISGGVKPSMVAKIEKKTEPIITQPKNTETKKEQLPVTVPSTINSNTASTPKTTVFVVTKKYDPNNSTQVGSRLAIAVLPFEVSKDASRYKDAVTNEMIDQLVNLRRFKVIERSSMDKIVAEQKIQASGFVDDKSAVKLGKIAGADALVIGNIILTGNAVKISARLVDVETAETLISEDAVSENNSQESIDVAIANVATMLYNELPIIEGDIIKVDAEELFIDIGVLNGVRKGTKCVVFRQGESIKHPISGEILGKKVTRLGEIIVIQVQDKFATVKPIDADQEIQVGDKVIIK